MKALFAIPVITLIWFPYMFAACFGPTRVENAIWGLMMGLIDWAQ